MTDDDDIDTAERRHWAHHSVESDSGPVGSPILSVAACFIIGVFLLLAIARVLYIYGGH